MSNETETKALELLQSLGQKVGQTFDVLWPKYVDFVWADGVAGLVTAALVSILTTVAVVIGFQKIQKHYDAGSRYSDVNFTCVMVGVFGGSAAACAYVFSISAIAANLPAVLAPEGAALKALLGAIK